MDVSDLKGINTFFNTLWISMFTKCGKCVISIGCFQVVFGIWMLNTSIHLVFPGLMYRYAYLLDTFFVCDSRLSIGEKKSFKSIFIWSLSYNLCFLEFLERFRIWRLLNFSLCFLTKVSVIQRWIIINIWQLKQSVKGKINNIRIRAMMGT